MRRGWAVGCTALAVVTSLAWRDELPATASVINAVALDLAPSDPLEWSSFAPRITRNGRVAAFVSASPNLVLGDTNARDDAFVVDLATGTRERVSVADDGSEGNDSTRGDYLAVSEDGRYVAFASYANNLVAGTTEINTLRVYVRDRLNQTTELVSPLASGFANADHQSMSANGRYVVFSYQDPTYLPATPGYVYLRDRLTGTLVALPGSNSVETRTAISADGHYVTYSDANQQLHIYDTQTGAAQLAVDTMTGQPIRTSGRSCLSATGRYIAYAADHPDRTPSWQVVEVYDQTTGTTQNQSVLADGTDFNQPSQIDTNNCISDDGNVVVFETYSSNVPTNTPELLQNWHVVARNRSTNTLTVLPAYITGNAPGTPPWVISMITGGVSGDGTRFVSLAAVAVDPSKLSSSCGFFSPCVVQHVVAYSTDVTDRTPPALQVPGDLLVPVAPAKPTVVSYSVQASDADSGLRGPATCTPASGATFVVGITVVTCKATDNAGNVATETFNVTVALRTTITAVEPVLQCVTRNADGSRTAHFGWDNPNNATVVVSPGAANRLLPSVAGVVPPSTFATGPIAEGFTVRYSGPAVSWQLNGRTATANPSSPAC